MNRPALCLILLLIFAAPGTIAALTRLGCLGLGVAEIWVPGVGYAVTQQWDKAAGIGGARWITSSLGYTAYESRYYQDDPDDIYRTVDADDSASGKTETHITLNKETWDANLYSSLNFNLLLTTWGDFYQHSCRPNTETYDLMLSPFRFQHFYRKWTFWVPMALLLANYTRLYDMLEEDAESKVTYHLHRGLTESEIRRGSFPKYYMVGVGEEMFSRGTLQHYFFETFRDRWHFSPEASRHLSIVSASAVFAAGHDGSGFTANAAWAFLFGVYEGYVYHPSLDRFDLTTAIAIHAWWDILVTYAILNNAEFTESEARVKIPLVSVGYMF